MKKVMLAFIVLFLHQIPFAQSIHASDYPTKSHEATFSARFTPLSQITLYDSKGNTVLTRFGQGEIKTEIREGIYASDFRDDTGMSAFSEDGRLMFVPTTTGAEIDVYPHYIRGIRHPLMRIAVGAGAVRQLKSEIIRRNSGDGFKNADGSFLKTNFMRPVHHTYNGDTSWMRSNVVSEGAHAMNGGYSSSWPTGDQYGTHSYLAEDSGAFNSMRTAYGTNLSCRKSVSVLNYTPCSLTYGYNDSLASFSYQGSRYKGGQCKAFTNLVAYRSGVLHGDNWAWKNLPSDSSTSSYPLLTSSNITVGDVIRRTGSNPHGGIVVRVISNGAVILDSNWVGGNGSENIGTHAMYFSGSGINNLGTYRRYTCVYTNNC